MAWNHRCYDFVKWLCEAVDIPFSSAIYDALSECQEAKDDIAHSDPKGWEARVITHVRNDVLVKEVHERDLSDQIFPLRYSDLSGAELDHAISLSGERALDHFSHKTLRAYCTKNKVITRLKLSDFSNNELSDELQKRGIFTL